MLLIKMSDDVPILGETEIVRLIHEHIRSLFPKTCPKCQLLYPTYRAYLNQTEPIGLPVSYDLEMGQVKPVESSGNLSLANCRCGNTISLSSQGMRVSELWSVLKWIAYEADRRKTPIPEVLAYIRGAVMKRELSSPS